MRRKTNQKMPEQALSYLIHEKSKKSLQSEEGG
jgi:hypothetical protein